MEPVIRPIISKMYSALSSPGIREHFRLRMPEKTPQHKLTKTAASAVISNTQYFFFLLILTMNFSGTIKRQENAIPNLYLYNIAQWRGFFKMEPDLKPGFAVHSENLSKKMQKFSKNGLTFQKNGLYYEYNNERV